MSLLRPLLLVVCLAVPACAAQPAGSEVRPGAAVLDSVRLVSHVRYLASPELEGRASGTPGSVAAREYIVTQLSRAGVTPVAGQWVHPFPLDGGSVENGTGANVVGLVRGTEQPSKYIMVTSHYDHLGRHGEQVFHGADDNASGTSALIELARYFADNPPRHSIIFAALDAEEWGLQGARAWIGDPPVPLHSIALNVNLDMVSRNEAGELYAAGTFHCPRLQPLVDSIAATAPITLLKGHDRPDGSAGDDWTLLSDHGAFHSAGIPFVYFGVEDHDDYHRPTDTFERIDPGFFLGAAETITRFLRAADERLEEIEEGV